MSLRHVRLGWLCGWVTIVVLLALPAQGADPAALPKEAAPAPAPAKATEPSKPAPPTPEPAKPAASTEEPGDEKPVSADREASAVQHDQETLELLKIFVDSLDQIERNYVKPVDRRELMEAAIQGMLERLDPHSSYIAPREVDRFRSVVESQFGGIGIQISSEQGQLKIISPLVGTPAYRAGLMAGDTIVEIDGKPASGLAIDEAVRRLKGPIGTKVKLAVLHAGSGKKESATLTREIVHVETVLGDRRGTEDQWDFMYNREKKIGYIRVTSFGRDTVRDLQRALTQLQNEKMRGLILDLRFNPGGLLTSAIETCDLFIDKGRIVSTKGRNVKERVWDAKPEGTFGGFPMAILVNHYSASASEIVSACLQDHQRAVIVGQRSWGKGSVQNVIDLEDGKSVLKLTTASYWRPNGKNIHRFPDAKDSDEWGVRPDKDYEVALATDELRELVEDRRQRDIVLPHVPEPKTTEPKTTEPKTTALKTTAPKTPEPKAADPKTATPISDAHVKPASKQSNAEPSSEEVLPDGSRPRKPQPYVDRQLQRALEYLNVEMARAS